jgi:transcriptional regulator with XRE-family HTH domain
MNSTNGSNAIAGGLNGAVAAELRAEKAALGLNNAELGIRAGIPKVSVQRYLEPARPINVDILEALAVAMGRKASDVIFAAEVRMSRQPSTAVSSERQGKLDAGVASIDDAVRKTRPTAGPGARKRAMQEMQETAARDEDDKKKRTGR